MDRKPDWYVFLNMVKQVFVSLSRRFQLPLSKDSGKCVALLGLAQRFQPFLCAQPPNFNWLTDSLTDSRLLRSSSSWRLVGKT